MFSKLNDQLIQLYVCQVCGQYIYPPIYQCTDDHLYCGECRMASEDLRVCPFCRLPIDTKNSRCIKLEKFAEGLDLLFPCKHGCGDALLLNDLHEHQSNCPMAQSVDHSYAKQQPLPDQPSIDQATMFHNTPNMKLPVMYYSPNIVSIVPPAIIPSQTHSIEDKPNPLMRYKGLCRIKEAVPTNIRLNKTFEEIENFIFNKAKTRDEYATFVAKVIMHIRKGIKINVINRN